MTPDEFVALAGKLRELGAVRVTAAGYDVAFEKPQQIVAASAPLRMPRLVADPAERQEQPENQRQAAREYIASLLT